MKCRINPNLLGSIVIIGTLSVFLVGYTLLAYAAGYLQSFTSFALDFTVLTETEYYIFAGLAYIFIAPVVLLTIFAITLMLFKTAKDIYYNPSILWSWAIVCDIKEK